MEKSLYALRKRTGARTTREMLHTLRNAPEDAAHALHFSPRGKEVFLLLREGLTHPQIAQSLGMSVNGVKRHKEKMLLRNDCKTILELIAKYSGVLSRI